MKNQEIYNIVKKHLLKYGADEIAEIIDIDEENLLRVVNKIAKNISDEISEQHVNIGSIGNIYDNRTEFTATIQENHNDSKALHIADVVARFSISKAIKFKLENGKYIDANGNEISTELLMKYKHEIYHDSGVLWLD